MKTRACLAVAVVLSGCATMRENRRQNDAERTQIDAAAAAKDAIALEELTTTASFLRNREHAVQLFVDLRLEQLAHAECAAFEAAFAPRPVTATNAAGEEWRPSTIVSFGSLAPEARKPAIATALLDKAAQCTSAKLFSARFRTLTREDDAAWTRRYVALEKQGGSLYEAFRMVLAAGDLSDVDVTATYGWLIATKTATDCKAFDEVTTDSTDVRSFMLGFYARKGCVEEGTRAARALITARAPENRSRACELMSLMGNTALLPQMKHLAVSDPAKTVDPSRRRGADVWVAYPVREVCQQAVNDLKLKSLTSRR